MNQRLKNFLSVSPLKITVLVIAVALALFLADVAFLRFMELKALDLRMVSRGAIQPGGEVVIVAIDEKSVGEMGRWPWSRSVVAGLVRELKTAGAKAIGFDVIFAEPEVNATLQTIDNLSRHIDARGISDARLRGILEEERKTADADAVLADAVAAAKNITLGYFFLMGREEAGHYSREAISAGGTNIDSSRYEMIRAKSKPDETALFRAGAVVANIPVLSDAAENCGYFNVFPDSDGSIRWAPLVIAFGDSYYASLPISLLLQYLDWPTLSLNMADYGVEGVKIGDIDIPTDEMGRLLVDYLGPAQTIPHYSICDVVNRRLPPDLFRDKIVLVGATATGIYDLRVTPFSAVYPGVEIHATVIDNILHRRFLLHSGWTSFLDACSIVVFGLVIGLAVPRVRAVQGIMLVASIMAAYLIANALVFARWSVWLNLVYPVLTMATIYLGIAVYRYVTEEKEKKKIRGAFQYYLTASVINEMLKDPSKLKLGGDKKDLSVLFSDIRGFTTVSEGLTPEELVRLLNEYLTAMTDIVFQYDGLLDKYMGDAIMAVYGAPLDQPDHALRACLTALDMMEELGRLQKKWAAEGRPVLNIGVGVNSGDMVVGNMGSQMRFDYTVMGDSVNLGSRLEGINKEYGTNIVISEFTHAVVKDALVCRELDAVRVKGKKLPVKIYELLARKRGGGDVPVFVGFFEEALEKYRRGAWDEAIAGFQTVLQERPGDPPAELYLERCRVLKENPPPAGAWDGVFTMMTK